ncbi:hypothetical protein Q7C_924 [Methylophaga frappieri]|uniref:Uncharacterized protein n=1 Tax=Methylophaga frappieri (strain ATCC BAA-2434 / DSM 25690 / JAM7) TaxID=754477 RepID=I1YGQ0_METFJ|nr:hypothetical protein Q7C_924 [Methylophaga frappieri]
MWRLHDVVLKHIGFGLVALPLAVPDKYFGIATSKEFCAIRRLSISGQCEVQDHAGLVLDQALFLFFVVLGVQGCQKNRGEECGTLAIDRREARVHLPHNRGEIIGFSVDVLAHDLNAVAVPDDEILVAVQLYAPTRLRVECLGVVTQGVRLAGASKHDRRRPYLADHDLLVLVVLLVIRILVQRPQVEVPRQASAMVLVRVAQQERIDIRPAVLIFLQSVAQILGDIARLTVRVVGVLPDVYVDQQGGCVEVAELDEGHVPVVDGKKRDGCGHWGSG